MDLHIPDKCAECELTEKTKDGKLCCRYKFNLVSAIGAVPKNEYFVDPEDIRPHICPYNQILALYLPLSMHKLQEK